MNPVMVAISMDDGTLSVMEFHCIGKSPTLPQGAEWMSERGELWTRAPNDANIAAEIARSLPAFNIYGDPQPQSVGFKVVDRAAFPADRTYRYALKLDGTKVVHDMPRAREYHRALLRHERAGKWPELDGQWTRATGQGKKAEADAIEAERQKWRDAPADPRIEAAQSVEELKQVAVA